MYQMRQKWGEAMEAATLTAGERALLAKTFLFQDTRPEVLDFALSSPLCRRESAAKGAEIYTPSQFQRCLGVVLDGRIQVTKGALIMSVLGPGDLFGAAALFHQGEVYATTLTAQRGCSLLLLPQALVEQLMARFPQVGRNYVSYLSGRIRFLSGKIETFTAGSVERKLAQYLLAHAQEGWAECSAAGLARRLGVGRASLYRAFDALTQMGLIRREGKRIQVLDVSGLSQV